MVGCFKQSSLSQLWHASSRRSAARCCKRRQLSDTSLASPEGTMPAPEQAGATSSKASSCIPQIFAARLCKLTHEPCVCMLPKRASAAACIAQLRARSALPAQNGRLARFAVQGARSSEGSKAERPVPPAISRSPEAPLFLLDIGAVTSEARSQREPP